MKLFLQRTFINALFLFALTILTISNVIAYRQADKSVIADNWVEHTHQVIDTTNKVLNSLTESGFSIDQFILTNDKKYLQDFKYNIQNSQNDIKTIQYLTTDNPIEQQRLHILQPLINARIQLMKNVIADFSQGKKTDAIIIATSAQRINLKNQTTGLLNNVIQEEDQLLGYRKKNTLKNLHTTNLLFISGGAFSEILLLFSMILLNYYSIHRDRLEKKRLESETRLQLLIDNTRDYAIFMLDKYGNIKTWNTGAERIIGYTAQEIEDRHFSIFYTERDIKRNHPYHELEMAVERGRYEEEGWRTKKDGTKFWANVIITPIYDEKANLLGFSKITRDLTEKRKIEQLKNEFVSVISHELRTPLTSIRGSLSLILGGACNDSPDKSNHLLEIASANCDRLLSLINDILDFEKIKAGKMKFKFQYHELDKLINEVISMNQMYAEKFNAKIIASNMIPNMTVYTDADRFIQVLTNLISNAVKFANSNTEINVSMTKLGHVMRVSVTNQGVGIPDEFKDKIFKRFSQADSSTARQHSGAGLGLAISKKIIDKLGGKIDFVSVPNEETTFYFELPLRKKNKF